MVIQHLEVTSRYLVDHRFKNFSNHNEGIIKHDNKLRDLHRNYSALPNSWECPGYGNYPFWPKRALLFTILTKLLAKPWNFKIILTQNFWGLFLWVSGCYEIHVLNADSGFYFSQDNFAILHQSAACKFYYQIIVCL